MYSPFDGHRPSVPPVSEQLRVIWRMQGPLSVVIAAIYAHPAGHELRVYFERSEDAVVYTQVGEVQALDAKAVQLRAVMLEQGWMPISHEPPRVQ
jgi:hypothetical protein